MAHSIGQADIIFCTTLHYSIQSQQSSQDIKKTYGTVALGALQAFQLFLDIVSLNLAKH
jgi:hypothetical protein